jgi:hypothetical protein
LGPVIVSDNRLGSGSVLDRTRESPLAPAVVFIFNIGVSNEHYTRQALFAMTGTTPSIAPGMDDFRIGGLLVNGNVSFTDNQCTLDLLEAGKSGVYAAATVFSFDDVAFVNNQCECSLQRREDYIVTNALVIGDCVRVTGNRFKEGLFQATYSAMTTGTMNMTLHNQSTHCLKAEGSAPLLIDTPNTILVNSMPNHRCERRLLDALLQLAALRSAWS